jgi:methylmalonyl-CoA/ethylmalonyl-CoA epimerase
VPVEARGIHHLGVAVADLDEAVDRYRRLFGAEVEHRETSADHGLEAASMRTGTGRVELLTSRDPETPVGKFLATRGPGMHHVAFEVDNVREELERLAADGAELIDRVPRRGLFGLEIAFLHPDASEGVLVELVGHG